MSDLKVLFLDGNRKLKIKNLIPVPNGFVNKQTGKNDTYHKF